MKTLFKNILVLVVMSVTFNNYANATLEVLPTFNNVKKGNSITVTDATGAVIFSGRINFDGNISRLYDFSQLKDGLYSIEVNKDYVIEISAVEVKNNSVYFIEHKNIKVFKPVFRIFEDSIIISKLALDTPEMEVKLYYEDELIYSETVKGKEILNRAYKIDKTIKGEYSVIVKTNDRVYVENFRI
ncbi:hypothetical protein [uncultured Winogradskyella sp.]|uniref:hypothetical protein n=1 Tax=uncultured Winogradskyella sp. TaxID=395353 RepID=UPI0026187BDA|nr:hypothetical protein [uncultured Winogradskyella sp.]